MVNQVEPEPCAAVDFVLWSFPASCVSSVALVHIRRILDFRAGLVSMQVRKYVPCICIARMLNTNIFQHQYQAYGWLYSGCYFRPCRNANIQSCGRLEALPRESQYNLIFSSSKTGVSKSSDLNLHPWFLEVPKRISQNDQYSLHFNQSHYHLHRSSSSLYAFNYSNYIFPSWLQVTTNFSNFKQHNTVPEQPKLVQTT